MKITYYWLKDFVEIKISPRQLADKLTMAGIEVKGLEEKDGDFVLDIETTSNRPDLLSVYGIAREVAVITGKSFKEPKPPKIATAQNKTDFDIKINSPKDCPLYTAKIIRGVKIGPSPGWLKKRLELVGCRSINNVVDITNYILFTYGEPLHAFDFDRISSEGIFVRRARRGERLMTIDAGECLLDEDMLVIADNNRILALAGIIGGKESEVSGDTKNILLEAAIFAPVLIRRARQKLGIETNSSYRFERGIDSETVQKASACACALILELASGKMTLKKETGLLKTRPRSILTEVASAEKILGSHILPKETIKILNRLGLKTKRASKKMLRLTIPPYRNDLFTQIDIVEELARIHGYDAIPNTLPKITPQPPSLQKRDLVSLTKQTLVALGLNEVITYSLISRSLWGMFSEGQDVSVIEVENPLSSEQEILRPSLIPSLVKCVAHNYNQRQQYVYLFEIAHVFSQKEGNLREELQLAIALSGSRAIFLEDMVVKDTAGLLHLKGIIETLCARLGVERYEFVNRNHNQIIDICISGEGAGSLYQIPRRILNYFDIKNRQVIVAQLSLDRLFAGAVLTKQFFALPKFPAITRDISFILKEEIPVQELLAALKEQGGSLLAAVTITDYYRGKQIPAGYRGITVSCVYRAGERTLREEEVNPIDATLRALLEKRFQAKMR